MEKNKALEEKELIKYFEAVCPSNERIISERGFQEKINLLVDLVKNLNKKAKIVNKKIIIEVIECKS